MKVTRTFKPEAESLAVVPVASVFAVRSTTEAPTDPLNPPRLNDPDDTRLGAYSFTLGYDPCGGAPPEFPETVTVRYELSGTASDEDHAGLSGTATFRRDDNNQYASQQMNYLAVDDTLAEPTEDLVVTILPGPGYEPGSSFTATTYIADNEPTVTISQRAQISEDGGGTATLTVTRSGPTALPLRVEIATSGTAEEVFDYTVPSDVLLGTAKGVTSDFQK